MGRKHKLDMRGINFRPWHYWDCRSCHRLSRSWKGAMKRYAKEKGSAATVTPKHPSTGMRQLVIIITKSDQTKRGYQIRTYKLSQCEFLT